MSAYPKKRAQITVQIAAALMVIATGSLALKTVTGQEFSSIQMLEKAFDELLEMEKPDYTLARKIFTETIKQGHASNAYQMAMKLETSNAQSNAWLIREDQLLTGLVKQGHLPLAVSLIEKLPNNDREQAVITIIQHLANMNKLDHALVIAETFSTDSKNAILRRQNVIDAYKTIVVKHATFGDHENAIKIINDKFVGVQRIDMIGAVTFELANQGYLEDTEQLMKRYLGWADIKRPFWKENVWQLAVNQKTQAVHKLVDIWAEFDQHECVSGLLALAVPGPNLYLDLEKHPSPEHRIRNELLKTANSMAAKHDVQLTKQDQVNQAIAKLYQGELEDVIQLTQKNSLNEIGEASSLSGYGIGRNNKLLAHGFAIASLQWEEQNRLVQLLQHLTKIESKNDRHLIVSEIIQVMSKAGRARSAGSLAKAWLRQPGNKITIPNEEVFEAELVVHGSSDVNKAISAIYRVPIKSERDQLWTALAIECLNRNEIQTANDVFANVKTRYPKFPTSYCIALAKLGHLDSVLKIIDSEDSKIVSREIAGRTVCALISEDHKDIGYDLLKQLADKDLFRTEFYGLYDTIYKFNTTEALRTLRRIHEIIPNSIPVKTNLAYQMADVGDLEALTLLNEIEEQTRETILVRTVYQKLANTGRTKEVLTHAFGNSWENNPLLNEQKKDAIAKAVLAVADEWSSNGKTAEAMELFRHMHTSKDRAELYLTVARSTEK